MQNAFEVLHYAQDDKWRGKGQARQTLLVVKFLFLLTAASCLQASAKGYGQTISLDVKNAVLEKVFIAIERQCDYHFIYLKEEIEKARPVSLNIKNAELITVLELCFAQQPLTYVITDKYIT